MDDISLIESVRLIDKKVLEQSIRDLPKWEGKEDWIKTVSRNHYTYEYANIFGRNWRSLQKWLTGILCGICLPVSILIFFRWVDGIQDIMNVMFYPLWGIGIWAYLFIFRDIEGYFFKNRLRKHVNTRPSDAEIFGEQVEPLQSAPSSGAFDVPPQDA